MNVESGAIALGHRLGTTGAVLMTCPCDPMPWGGIRCGFVTLCVVRSQDVAPAQEQGARWKTETGATPPGQRTATARRTESCQKNPA